MTLTDILLAYGIFYCAFVVLSLYGVYDDLVEDLISKHGATKTTAAISAIITILVVALFYPLIFIWEILSLFKRK